MDLSPYSPAQCAQGQHYLYLCSLHRSIGIRSAVRCLVCAAFGKGKCKVRRRTGHECPKEEKRYNSTPSLTSAQDGVSGQRDTPAALHPPREGPSARCMGGWVGPRAGLDGCGKSRLPPGFDPWTVHPLARRYTD